MKDKIKTRSMMIVVIIGLITLALFALGSVLTRKINLGSEQILMLLVLVLLICSAFLTFTRLKGHKKGMPVEDEMTKRIAHRSGFYAWLIAVWTSVILMWYNIFADKNNLTQLTTEQITGFVVLLPAICFFAFYFYFHKKGDA